MKKLLIPFVLVAALAACDKTQIPTWTNPEQNPGVAYDLKVAPVITKVTETKFDGGDAVGVTVTREAGVWADNEKLIFDGSIFYGDVKWYAEGADEATVTAYYPYAAEVPTTFTVMADQTQGSSASDFVAGSRANVLPSAEAVVIPFQHKLSLLVVDVVNNAGADILGITISGAKLKANLAEDFTATVDETAAPASVKTFNGGPTTYAAIVPPQTAVLTAKVLLDGESVVQEVLGEAALDAGKKYTIHMIVNQDNIKIMSTGDVQDWEDGGDLNPKPVEPVQFSENLSDGYITYDNVQYTVARMKDNKWWMTQNLAYLPEGYTPASELSAVTAGVFYPVKINEGQTAAEFDLEGVEAKGYLYQAEVALGLTVGDITTVAEAEALEGAQGICPTGWHVPSYADLNGLTGKMNTLTNAEAPYLSNGNASIVLMNEDGFNMDAFGAISIQDVTKTAGTFMGWASGYPDKLSSGMFCGSSYAGVTYNTKDVPESGIKNIQFWGMMPMTNKASEDQYTCNCTKVSYRIAGPLRCVRDSE